MEIQTITLTKNNQYAIEPFDDSLVIQIVSKLKVKLLQNLYLFANSMESNQIDPYDAFSITNSIHEMFHCIDTGSWKINCVAEKEVIFLKLNCASCWLAQDNIICIAKESTSIIFYCLYI